MSKKVLIIGAGIAGLETAYNLAINNISVTLLESKSVIGGNIRKWVKLFPDYTDANDISNFFYDKIKKAKIELHIDTEIENLYYENEKWNAIDSNNNKYIADIVVLATGFNVFDATRKEELGYGIYENVITSVDFERMYKTNSFFSNSNKVPNSIAFLNCVGSRDAKIGNHYCSRLCCINAVKQASEFKELYPKAEAYIFYMDLRMAGQQYEELYRTSQEKYAVHYIRGRISEAAITQNMQISIKAEDTLLGQILKLNVDMLVLMVGMEASPSTTKLAKQNNILGDYGFAKSLNLYGQDNLTDNKTMFLAGTCKRPLSIPETIADARAASLQIINYIINENSK